ncbi:MAG: carotenoid 1,2-hydratase [Deltaproteobacteria bacterium]|nr:carotenoid 1,2-hydratase [Deltaproteobacteria bacterium]
MQHLESWSRRRLVALGLLAVLFLASSYSDKLALPGRQLSFPNDHFSHPDDKTEWWYYTGHLEADEGGRYGFQVTFFRFGLRDRQAADKAKPPLFTDLYMAHFALSDKRAKKFYFRERANRGYEGKAGAQADRYYVWNEDWTVEEKGGIHFIRARDRELALVLKLAPLKPPVLHGQNGLSQKGEGEGRASYYYSLTRLKTEGQLEIAGKTHKVRGLSWMDHEFGSNQLGGDQLGWDWFSLQLGNRTELMLYVIRRKDGSPDSHSSGTLVYPDGRSRHLKLDEFRIDAAGKWASPKSGAAYPMGWKISVPAEGIAVEVSPSFPGQELDTRKSTRVTYWEGAVEVRGTYRGRSITGQGYVEMTGYAGRLKV